MQKTSLRFEDIFEVISIDPEGKHFDRVSRFECRGENTEIHMQLDVNIELIQLPIASKFTCLVTTNIGISEGDVSTIIQDYQSDDPDCKKSLLDSYDYVMSGRVFRIVLESKTKKCEVIASFGGLLMSLKGSPKSLEDFQLDLPIFILLRKNIK